MAGNENTGIVSSVTGAAVGAKARKGLVRILRDSSCLSHGPPAFKIVRHAQDGLRGPYDMELDAAVAKPAFRRAIARDRIGAAIAFRNQRVRVGARLD